MSFVDECRKEWHRLGVPDAVSNEMAADLAADLAEAQADGVSPEEVLGNGVFDAKAFAASWATARGVVGDLPRARVRAHWARWVLAACAALSLVAAGVGVGILGRRQSATVAGALYHKSLRRPAFFPPTIRIGPGFGGHVIFSAANTPVALGLILLVVGLAGLCVSLWLWRPWSAWRRAGLDDSAGLPSYL